MITATSSTGSNPSTSSRTSIANTFDNFLQLLTKQLENQDPLSPMDATQFTSQLVQFSTVEQAINTNSKLDRLIEVISTSAQTSALQYIDNLVEIDTRVAQLPEQGEASFAYSLPKAAKAVQITVADADGNVVLEKTGSVAAGANIFTWEGKGSAGGREEAGIYRIEVTAVDEAGEAMAVAASASGTVSGVSTLDGRLVLTVDGAAVPVEAVTSVRRREAAAA